MTLCVYRGLLDGGDWYQQLASQLSWTEFKPYTKTLRLCARLSDEEIHERYPNLTEIVEGLTGRRIISTFVNGYRNGNDIAPYHRDPYGMDSVVLSFGGPRDFLLRTPDKFVGQYVLSNGDVVMFPEQLNLQCTHSIPKRSYQNDPRISMLCFLA